MELRDPREIVILDDKGNPHTFTLSSFSAWDGSEILERYPSHILVGTAIPRLYDREIISELKLKIMKYVAIKTGDRLQRLETVALIENHVPDALCLHQLLAEEVKYNNRFFRDATLLIFLKKIAIGLLPRISEILTPYLEPSSTTAKPPSTNSAQSTP